MRDPNINDPNKLESYNSGLGAMFPEYVDPRNARKLRQRLFDFIPEQKKEIIDAKKFREESRKASKQATILAKIGIVIATATLIATLIGWFV